MLVECNILRFKKSAHENKYTHYENHSTTIITIHLGMWHHSRSWTQHGQRFMHRRFCTLPEHGRQAWRCSAVCREPAVAEPGSGTERATQRGEVRGVHGRSTAYDPQDQRRVPDRIAIKYRHALACPISATVVDCVSHGVPRTHLRGVGTA